MKKIQLIHGPQNSLHNRDGVRSKVSLRSTMNVNFQIWDRLLDSIRNKVSQIMRVDK